MPVKIRLTRMGKKRQPSYRVVVMDSRSPRDGRYLDQIGRYDPRQEPSLIEIDNDKALDWLEKGAQPTDTAKKLLEVSGAWTRFRIARGDIHTVGEEANAKAAKAPVAAPTVAEVEAEVEAEPEIHVVETFEEEREAPEAGTTAEPDAVVSSGADADTGADGATEAPAAESTEDEVTS